ncbi:MAG: DASS family sodium-coupled anion symporter [Gammaproteobacteria bacterium]|nr:DASS family sodium-coupled anion symporter [Gammaproteobacteria bacterium]
MNIHKFGFWLGTLLFILMLIISPPNGLDLGAWRVAALTVLIGCWWFTEAVPVTLTGSLPFLLLPLLGVAKPEAVASQYMSPILFLVLGGSLIGLAFEKWNLHRRIALYVVTRASPEPRKMLLALMAVTAFLSMFVNNSATTVMMLPIAAATLSAVTRTLNSTTPDLNEKNFAAAMLLSVAYASNIGGFGTPIGTPVNPIAIAIIERNVGVHISFIQWLSFGLPFVFLGIPLCWWLISRVTLPFNLPIADKEQIRAAIGTVGVLSTPEKRVLSVVFLASLAWIFQPIAERLLPGISDSGIAIGAALLLCILPSGDHKLGASPVLLEWNEARNAPWYLILLLGGGLALADSVVKSGLSAWLAGSLGAVSGLPLFPLILLIALMCSLVTEFASNVATATIFTPIAVSLALGGGYDPVGPALAAGLAASLGFANPAATSSNALVFATGKVRMADMLKTGLLFDLLGAFLLASVCFFFI